MHCLQNSGKSKYEENILILKYHLSISATIIHHPFLKKKIKIKLISDKIQETNRLIKLLLFFFKSRNGEIIIKSLLMNKDVT